MVNINKVNVLIIVIFVIIFITYFSLERKYLQVNYLQVKEEFEPNNGPTDLYDNIIEAFTHIMKVINTDKDININRTKVLNILKNKNFIFSNIIKNKYLKIEMTNTQSLYQKANKYLNRAINISSKYMNDDFFKNLKIFFTAKKELNELYIKYFDANFNFNAKINNNQNDIILKNKLELQERIIQNHDNVSVQITNLKNNSDKMNVNEKLRGLYDFYIDSEKLKNEQLKVLVENSSLYTILNNIKNLKTISSQNIKVYSKVVVTKKNVLNNISKICDNQNDSINTYLKSGLSDANTKNEEINYLHSSNNNNNTLINFCKKMRKIDSPSEGGLMFKRFNKEFKKKKDTQIIKLEGEIDNIINGMSKEDVDNFNLYIARTNDQAGKQIDAIKIAKDNLENAKKLKVNIS